MDYEKKYKQLNTLISDLYPFMSEYCKEKVEGFFPELKESEDERMRRWIINYLDNKALNSGIIQEKTNIKNAIAWLEKQGEKHIDRELSKLLNRVICRFINDPNIPYSERDEVSKNIIPYVEQLERQGEQKSIDDLTPQEAMDIAVAKCFEQGEQKSTDVDNKFIRMRETKPKDISEFLNRLTTVEQEFLWEHIEKIRELDKEEQKPTVIIPKFRVGDEIKTSNEESLTITKIDEKGYWSEDLFICGFDDADKWELVEQKPAWSEEDEKAINDIMWIIEAYRENGFNEIHKQMANNAEKWLKSLKDRVLSQQKQEWSEEDNETLDRIISNYQYFCKELFLKDGLTEVEKEVINNVDKEDTDWLKSLKYRVQPKREWSEEDETGLTNTIIMLKEGASLHFNKKDITKAVDWLKSLRPQSQWKPSDEQMEALEALVKDNNQRYFYTTLNSLYEQLKKLKL